MRKLTLEIEPHEEMRKNQSSMFEIIHSYEILESLSIEWDQCICVDLMEFTLKDGISINDLKWIDDMEIMSIIRSEGPKHTCLVRSHEKEESKEINKEFNLDLIYTTPLIIKKDHHIYSVIGEQKNLLRFVELIKIHAGSVVKMTFTKAKYQKQDILSVLTDKQRDIIVAAHKHGYYDYPKKINSQRLSEKVNISKGTMVEHLRKAEGRILGEILAGYSG
jgi:predicted DNA binding protein